MGKKGFVAGFAAVAMLISLIALPAAAGATDAGASAKKPVKLRVVMVGLAGQGKPMVAASRISFPGGSQYRHFLTQDQYRRQFGATPATVGKIRSLKNRRGVRQVMLNPTRTAAILIMTPPAARRLFCAGQNLTGKP